MKFLHRNDELTRNKGNLVRMCGWWKRGGGGKGLASSYITSFSAKGAELRANCSAGNLERVYISVVEELQEKDIERRMERKERGRETGEYSSNEMKAWEDF